MSTKKSWRWMSMMVVFAMLLSTGTMVGAQPVVAPDAATAPQTPPPPAAAKAAPQAAPAAAPAEDVWAKLDPGLRELAQAAALAMLPEMGPQAAAPQESVLIQIFAGADAQGESLVDQLRPYFVDGQLYGQPPLLSKAELGASVGQLLVGRILPGNLVKVASVGAVREIYAVEPERMEYEPYPADDTAAPRPGPQDWSELRANADDLREGSLPWQQARAFGDGRVNMEPQDWFEVTPGGPHQAQDAWARNYRGEGVAVSVIDDGVDFAHPDIMGAQRIYSSTEAPQYNGWPMVMDPFAMRAYFYDLMFGTTYVSGSFAGVTYIDTSATPKVTQAGVGISTFQYTPMIDFNIPGLQHTYVISNAMSQSGVVHVGTHTDESLRDYIWGEKVAVLVCDPNVAGVYDTVYVDLDDDYDFRDEKPLTRADVDDPSTYNDMVAYRDMNGDGLADLSGGLLYFIADGVNYVPAMDWLFALPLLGIDPPEPGALIAMHGPWDSGYSHGTQCASNVVGNGTIDGMLPSFSDLPGDGLPAAAVYGAAPEADLVPMNSAWSFTGRVTYNDAYMLAAVGWDGVDQTGWHMIYGPGFDDTDAIQATSNSYGWSGDDNDGWDMLGQYIWQLQRYYAPSLQFLFSTGNGAPGYGTAAPPSPGLGIMVGASTEYGSTGWDSITETTQINFNDYTAFSNSGPGALGGAGVDVLAGGSYAAGAEELNYYVASSWGVLDGNLSWATWGGTSRSAPAALGNLALIYQAYKAKHGVWPTAAQARALFMSSATDINNGVLRQGAGVVNADRGTAVAGGHYGVYMGGDSATWQPGDYRGTNFPGFAHIAYPGDTWNKTFTVHNDSAADISVDLTDQTLALIDSVELEFTVTPTMTQQESVYGAANRDNFYKAFQYFIPITATPGMDDSWYNVDIPADTDLMVVRQIFPYDEFDVDGNYVWDQRFYLMVYNWKDVNGNGLVWDDKNSNGVVNFINGTEWTSVDVGPELLWDDARTELDRWEYARYGYNRPAANSNELTVQDPLNRMHDGMFIGLRHLYTSASANTTVHLQYRIEFYQKADVPWLSTDVTNLVVPAGGTATFDGSVNVPANMPPGVYEAAIEVGDPGLVGGEAHTTVIPVVMNVAARYTGSGALTLGGAESYAYDADRPYNNAAVRGYQEWSWREESGDWRFFYLDVENECHSWVTNTVTLLSENFDGAAAPALPAGWATVPVYFPSGTEPKWATNAGTLHPSGGGAHSAPNVAYFNSFSAADPKSARLYTTGGLDLSNAASAELTFWMYHDTGYSGTSDTVQPQVSINGGAWTDVGSPAIRDDGTTGWRQETVDLSAYAGAANVQIGLLGISGFGNDCHIDDVAVTAEEMACDAYTYPPDAHVLVRDQWSGAAPHNDIDTIVLGPSPTQLNDVDYGAWNGDFSEPAFFGPYVLNPIAKSAVDRSGRATWRFNTTSGGNEDWVMFPASSAVEPFGGLHEILQHHVLFEGDEFDVVFTKTVGMLTEDQHDFAIETYVDAGTVGQVTLESTIELNGLEATGYLIDTQERVWTNAPIAFAGPNSYEWTSVFAVADGVSIELWTSSADIPDIDLALFWNSGTAWVQVGSSGGVDSNEHIMYNNPADGTYLIAINNYSGPAGTFNLTRVVKSKVPGIAITGTSDDPVAADTPITLTITYDYPMEPGVYDGMVLVGPPEAPQLKQIPIEIVRLPSSAMIEKTVDEPIAFPGGELHYTIDLYNLSDPAAQFEFSDPIPPGTEFVAVTGATYDALNNRVVYTGTLPVSMPPSNSEGFEDGVVPPPFWTHVQNNATETWYATTLSSHSGAFSAQCDYDAALDPQNEWLISPLLVDLTGGEPVSLWSMGSYYWGVDPEDTYDLNVWLIVGDLGGADDVLLGNAQDDWPTTNWVWTQSTFNLPATLPAGDLRIGFQYVGMDGAQANVDDIVLPGTLAVPPMPSRVVEVTVRVTDTVAAGDWITNTATLLASHAMPNGAQEEEVSDSAVSQVSIGPDFSTSYKTATAEVLAGGLIKYEVHVKNTGTELAYVTLTDPLPAGTSYADHNYDPPYQYFAYDGVQDRMEWSGNVAPGQEMVFTFWVEVDDDDDLAGTAITNVATITWGDESLEVTADTDVLLEGVPLEGIDFTWLPARPVVGEDVEFTAQVMTGTAPFTYTWDFGDGSAAMVATTAAVQHAFPVTLTVQSYTVTLTVENDFGPEQMVAKLVTVEPYTVYLPIILQDD